MTVQHRNQNFVPLSEENSGIFPFYGEVLALDLVNTEIVRRRKVRDTLQKPEDTALWWQEVQLHYPEVSTIHLSDSTLTFNAYLLDALKRLRAALRRLFSACIDGETPENIDLYVLNAALDIGRQWIEVTPNGTLSATYRTANSTITGILFPIALSALTLLKEGDLSRLHKCGNPSCILFFYDTTKSATRRWCSVACRDRAKSTVRYAQMRKGNVFTN